jgi:hypothetical protein
MKSYWRTWKREKFFASAGKPGMIPLSHRSLSIRYIDYAIPIK